MTDLRADRTISNVPDGMQPVVLARLVEERLKAKPDAAVSAVFVARDGRRLQRMVDEGALEEVRALLELRLDDAKPAMKAIGVREFREAIEGRLPLEEAVERAKIATRQYAKRQATWFRHQLDDRWSRVGAAA